MARPLPPTAPADPKWIDEALVQTNVHTVCDWATKALPNVPNFIIPKAIRAIMLDSLNTIHTICDDDDARKNLVDMVNAATGASAPNP